MVPGLWPWRAIVGDEMGDVGGKAYLSEGVPFAGVTKRIEALLTVWNGARGDEGKNERS
jgi:hypothetical protein